MKRWESSVHAAAVSGLLEPEHLGFSGSGGGAPPAPLPSPASPAPASPAAAGGEMISLAEVEKRHILAALEQTRQNRTHAAKILGISIRTLRNKLNEYGVKGKDSEGETA